MMLKRIGVGVIGVQPHRSWGAVAHIPALRLLADRYTIAGLANSTAESAQEAARQVGVERAFPSAAALIASPDVQLVSICVKVPHHYDYARAAIDGGKHVICEWPLALSTEQAVDLATRARRMGVVALVGTQAVLAPAVASLAKLRAEGAFGTLFSSTIVASGMTWGEAIEQRNAYLLDASNGATMLTIAVGHMLSAVECVFGPVETVNATLKTRRKTVRIIETGEQLPLRAPDQILLACTFADGMPLSLHYRGGTPTGLGLIWEVQGSDAVTRIEAASGLIEMTGLSLSFGGGGQALELVESPVADPMVDGVRRLYEAAYDQILGRASVGPTFDRAVRLHSLIDVIHQSARTGSCTRAINALKTAPFRQGWSSVFADM